MTDHLKDSLFRTVGVGQNSTDSYADHDVDGLLLRGDTDAFSNVMDSSLAMAQLALALLDQAGVTASTQELVAFALANDTGLRKAHADDEQACRAALAKLTGTAQDNAHPLIVPNTMTAVRRFSEREDARVAAAVAAAYEASARETD